MTSLRGDLPLPPLSLRKLVGDPPTEAWANPAGTPLFEQVPVEGYERYLDLGCGCGRSARRLMQMRPQPSRYLGVDLHKGMIDWCQKHLAAINNRFRFVHHPVYNALLNPDPRLPVVDQLPAEDGAFTFVEATSVFTHLVEPQAEYYLDEVRRVLDDGGWFVATWFLFDRRDFPVLQPFQHAIYINETDPTNAVFYDREWLPDALARRGLVVAAVVPPEIRGYHWYIFATPARAGIQPVSLPSDDAASGSLPPPARLPTRDERLAQFDGCLAPARELLEAKRYIADLERHLAMKEAELRRVIQGLGP